MISQPNKDQSPPVFGLVLAGGKSIRMGQDKGAISWHNKEQRYHMYELLSTICDNVFISCRATQKTNISDEYQTVIDTHIDTGPIFALLTAFEFRPDVAWFVVACDLPLLDVNILNQLLQKRSVSGVATTFKSPHDGLPEPLVTIWEPKSYVLLRQHVSDGYRCPRKVLINNADKVNTIQVYHPEALLNANTQEDASKVKTILENAKKR